MSTDCWTFVIRPTFTVVHKIGASGKPPHSLFMIIVLKKVSGFKNNQSLESKINYELLKFSYPLMFVTILQTLMHWMDILMLGYFTNPLTVGLYHPAARTAGLLQALLLSFLSIYAPLAAQYQFQLYLFYFQKKCYYYLVLNILRVVRF